MSVKIQPVRLIIKELGIEPDGPVQAYFTERCKDYMEQFVPMRDNVLRQIVTLKPSSIKYEMPYARYQFYGVREDGTHKVNPENYTTPGTGPRWDLRMKTAYMDKITKEVSDYIKLRGKNGK